MKKAQYVQIAALSLLIICSLSFVSKSLISNHVLVAQAIGSSNLIAHYTFNETTGDASGNGYNSNFIGSPTYTTGNVGVGLSMSAGNYVNLPASTAANLGSEITYAAWVKFSSVSGDRQIIMLGADDPTTAGAYLRVIDGGAVYFVLGNGTTRDTDAFGLSGANAFQANTWYHITVTASVSQAQKKLFINGVLKQTLPIGITGNFSNANLPSHALGNWAGNYFNGVLDDVRIYSRVLQDSEITGLVALGGTGSAPTGNTSEPPPPTGGGTTNPPIASDTTAPVISQISSVPDSDSANISWTTDEAADTFVEYGPTTNYGNSVVSPSLLQSHSISVNSLTASTLYHFRVKSKDSSGNTSTSADQTFTTTATVVDTPPPAPPSSAQVVGSEALLSFPNRALWNGLVTFRPGNGEVVDLNPPKFSWLYTPDPSTARTDIEEKKFIFQTSYDSSFSTYRDNVLTSSNMYNTIAPFNSGSTVYWRVGYIHDGQTTPYVWSKTRSFTVGSAKTWDRSKLADENYLASKTAHPHVLFNTTTRKQMYDWIKNQPFTAGEGYDPAHAAAKAWYYAKDDAKNAIAASWWPQTNPTTPGNSERATNIAKVAFVLQLTSQAADGSADKNLYNQLLAAKPQDALVRFAEGFVAQGADRMDQSNNTAAGEDSIRNMAYAYDWLYEYMTDTQRATVLKALEGYMKFVENVIWWRIPKNSAYRYTGDPTGVYAGGFNVIADYGGSHAKTGDSHGFSNYMRGMVAALATYGESTAGREFFNLGVNYLTGVMYPFGYDGGVNQGREYSEIALSVDRIILVNSLYQVTFPEIQFGKNTFFDKNVDWFSRMHPVGFVQGHDPWGDTGWGWSYTWFLTAFGRDLSYLTGSSFAYKHWKEDDALFPGFRQYDSIQQIPTFYYAQNGMNGFGVPSQNTNTKKTQLYPEEGWAIGCSYSSETSSCFNQGTGFVFQARPRGSEAGHSHYSDLSYQLWAYGTAITDAASGYSTYGKVPEAHYTLLINGNGPYNPETPAKPFYSRFTTYKEGSNFTLVGADATNAYMAKTSGVKKVRRNILWVRDKYFVVYDDVQNSSNSTFSFPYHILENTLTPDFANGAWSYTSNIKNFVKSTDSGSTVKVLIKNINDPATVTYTDLSGTSVYKNPITGQDYYGVSYDDHIRAHVVWVSNKTQQPSFHFMTVIYPQKPGASAPKIERLDDYTAKVTNDDGSVDVISFNPYTAGTYNATILVDLSKLTPLPVTDDITGATVSSVSYVPPSTPTPVAGVCSAVLNECAVGTFVDQTDTSTDALWQCKGLNNGATASCKLPLTKVIKPGDFDGDGIINTLDYSYMNSVWNTSDAKADLNKDGKVNTLDFAIMVKNWTPIGF
jgi:hypothetical protein